VLQERRQRAGELVQHSLEQIGADDLAGARATLGRALALVPDNAFALFNLALVEMRGGAREEAIAGFERLISLEAGRPGSVPPEVRSPALATLGLLYYEKGFLDEARRYLEAATELEPASARTWNNLGLTLRRQGDAAAAERAFRRARDLAPDDAQAANNLGLLLVAAERWPEAVAVLRDATGRAPDNAAAWLNLGLAHRGDGDLAAAARALDRALALDDGNAAGLGARAASYLAVVRFEQGDVAGAAAAAAQAIAWRPEDLEAWVYQGLAQQLQGDPAAARESFRRAILIDPTRAELHNNLGTALVSLDDLEGAAAAFRQALALRPGFAEAQANLDEVTSRLAAGLPVGQRPVVEVERASGARPERRPRPLGARFGREDASPGATRGARITSVQGGSPAALAGLRVGDLVLAVDGKPIQDAQQLLTYIGRLESGRDAIELDILRDGKPRRLRVVLY
jgi:Tfp pilus assembly protein PilF